MIIAFCKYPQDMLNIFPGNFGLIINSVDSSMASSITTGLVIPENTTVEFSNGFQLNAGKSPITINPNCNILPTNITLQISKRMLSDSIFFVDPKVTSRNPCVH
jgi:hypothetical protein